MICDGREQAKSGKPLVMRSLSPLTSQRHSAGRSELVRPTVFDVSCVVSYVLCLSVACAAMCWLRGCGAESPLCFASLASLGSAHCSSEHRTVCGERSVRAREGDAADHDSTALTSDRPWPRLLAICRPLNPRPPLRPQPPPHLLPSRILQPCQIFTASTPWALEPLRHKHSGQRHRRQSRFIRTSTDSNGYGGDDASRNSNRNRVAECSSISSVSNCCVVRSGGGGQPAQQIGYVASAPGEEGISMMQPQPRADGMQPELSERIFPGSVKMQPREANAKLQLGRCGILRLQDPARCRCVLGRRPHLLSCSLTLWLRSPPFSLRFLLCAASSGAAL